MKKKKQTSKHILYMLVVMMLFTITIYNNSNVNTNNASALTYSNNVDLEYTFATTLDVTFSTNTGFVIDELAPGTAAYSNTVTVTASSNSADGFTMSATAGNSSDANRNNNRLVNSDNTNYFESVATNANVALESLGTDKWGYSVYDAGTSTWSNYNGLPAIGSTGTPLADMDEAGSTSVDMRIGASSTNTQVSGTFTNNINFAITAKIVTYDYTITYRANNPSSTDNVINIPTDVTVNDHTPLSTGDVLNVSSKVPILINYIFDGWCNGAVSGNICSGELVQPGDSLKMDSPVASDSGMINNIILSAIWKPYMQNINDWKDALLANIHDEVKAIDSRDNKEYQITKLLDNRIWMTQNLALGKYAAMVLESTDTNLNNGIAAYDLPASSTSGFLGTSTQKIYSTDNQACSGIQPCYGYYTWAAATAGTNPSINDATSDICPRNWRLPTSTEFSTLKDLYSANGDMASNPFSGVYAGFRNGNSFYEGGNAGLYWSSTANSTAYAYRMVINNKSTTISAYYKDYGSSIRCIAKE